MGTYGLKEARCVKALFNICPNDAGCDRDSVHICLDSVCSLSSFALIYVICIAFELEKLLRADYILWGMSILAINRYKTDQCLICIWLAGTEALFSNYLKPLLPEARDIVWQCGDNLLVLPAQEDLPPSFTPPCLRLSRVSLPKCLQNGIGDLVQCITCSYEAFKLFFVGPCYILWLIFHESPLGTLSTK